MLTGEISCWPIRWPPDSVCTTGLTSAALPLRHFVSSVSLSNSHFSFTSPPPLLLHHPPFFPFLLSSFSFISPLYRSLSNPPPPLPPFILCLSLFLHPSPSATTSLTLQCPDLHFLLHSPYRPSTLVFVSLLITSFSSSGRGLATFQIQENFI